jgi:hypothetical protein
MGTHNIEPPRIEVVFVKPSPFRFPDEPPDERAPKTDKDNQ